MCARCLAQSAHSVATNRQSLTHLPPVRTCTIQEDGTWETVCNLVGEDQNVSAGAVMPANEVTRTCRMGATLTQGNPGTGSNPQTGCSLAGLTKCPQRGQRRSNTSDWVLLVEGARTVSCAFCCLGRDRARGEGNRVAEQGWGRCDRELREAAGLLQERDTCLPATKPGSLETKSQR